MTALAVSKLFVRIASDQLILPRDAQFGPMFVFLFMAVTTALLADFKVNRAD